MRLVDLRDGALELRWTWLPYWIAAGPTLQGEVETILRDAVIINGMPPNEDSLSRIEAFVVRLLTRRFQIEGLGEYLLSLHLVQEPG